MAPQIEIVQINPANRLQLEARVVGWEDSGFVPGRIVWRQLTPPPLVDLGETRWDQAMILTFEGDPAAVFRLLAIMYDAADSLEFVPAMNYDPEGRRVLASAGQAVSSGWAYFRNPPTSVAGAGAGISAGRAALRLRNDFLAGQGGGRSAGAAWVRQVTVDHRILASGHARSEGEAPGYLVGPIEVRAHGHGASEGSADLRSVTWTFIGTASGHGASDGSADIKQGSTGPIGTASGRARSNGRAWLRFRKADSDVIRTMPDVERWLAEFVRVQPELAILGGRVYTVLPAGPKTYPLLRLWRVGGIPPFTIPWWIDVADIQIDVWGQRKSEARAVADTVRACMALRLRGRFPDGVVTDITLGALYFQPDTDRTDQSTRAGLNRYRFDASITLHPRPDTPAPPPRRGRPPLHRKEPAHGS